MLLLRIIFLLGEVPNKNTLLMEFEDRINSGHIVLYVLFYVYIFIINLHFKLVKHTEQLH